MINNTTLLTEILMFLYRKNINFGYRWKKKNNFMWVIRIVEHEIWRLHNWLNESRWDFGKKRYYVFALYHQFEMCSVFVSCAPKCDHSLLFDIYFFCSFINFILDSLFVFFYLTYCCKSDIYVLLSVLKGMYFIFRFG